MVKSEKITIEKLAAMVQEGFGEMAKKTDMDAGFQKVNDRLDAVIEKHDEEVKDIKERIVVLEKALEIE